MQGEGKKPAIRFAGFTDEWEQRKLGEVVDVCSGRDYKHLSNGDIPVYGTGGYMLSVNKALSYDKDAVGIGRKGTIDKPYLLKAPFWTVDTLFYAIPKVGNDLNFIYDIFQNIDWKNKDESTGVPSLSKTAINEIFIRMPEIEEQTKLGKFFKQLDSLITLHQRQHEKLQNIKKSMLEKMFPQNESNVPEIRFAGFSAPWEQRKLGDIAEKTYGGGTPSTNIEDYWNGDIPWFQSSDILEGNVFITKTNKHITTLGISNSAAQKIPANSVAIVTRVGVGKLAFVPFSYTTSQDFLSLSKLNTDPIFTVYACQRKLQAELNAVQGTSIKGITKDELLSKSISVPIHREQKKIGEFFSSLDRLFTLHQQKLEKIQAIKKSLLEKMFV